MGLWGRARWTQAGSDCTTRACKTEGPPLTGRSSQRKANRTAVQNACFPHYIRTKYEHNEKTSLSNSQDWIENFQGTCLALCVPLVPIYTCTFAAILSATTSFGHCTSAAVGLSLRRSVPCPYWRTELNWQFTKYIAQFCPLEFIHMFTCFFLSEISQVIIAF